MNKHATINYIELPCSDMDATKEFFSTVFGWTFEDYGPDYIAFANAGLAGGFYRSLLNAQIDTGSALVIIYSDSLKETMNKIESTGGIITRSIFAFPGGRRFHFSDPSRNDFAVWSDEELA